MHPRVVADAWVAWQNRSEMRSWPSSGCGQTVQAPASPTEGRGEVRVTLGVVTMGKP
jgi:hypothetical protein